LNPAGRPEVQVAGGPAVVTVTVGTGRRRNALSLAGWTELARQLAQITQLPELRAVLVRGSGRGFCAGSDLNDWSGAGHDRVDASFAAMESTCSTLEECPVPVVVAIQGDAVGAGCQLALAGDVRLLRSGARMGMPVLKLGIQISPRFTARLVEQAGWQVAADLLFTGRLLDASEALERGLVARVAEPADWDRLVSEVVAAVVALPADAARAAKHSLIAQRAARRHTLPARIAEHSANLADLHAGVQRFLCGHGEPDRAV
jgi:enoyl-CoA hydratase/carnithine racemase